MHLDLIFVPRHPEPSDTHLVANRATSANRHSANRHSANRHSANRHNVQWERVRTRLASEMPSLLPTNSSTGRRRDDALGDATLGLALRRTPDHFVLTASTDVTGIDTATIVDALRRTAAIVETETGLVAYDPQSKTRFLHDDPTTDPTDAADEHALARR